MFQVGLQCNSWFLSATNDNVNITIMNGYQQTIIITNATCQTQGFTGAWTQYDPPITIPMQEKARITINNLYDASGSKLYFNNGDVFTGKSADVFTGKCTVEFYFVSDGPSFTRRNTADVRFTVRD
jgi:hypothetical protein